MISFQDTIESIGYVHNFAVAAKEYFKDKKTEDITHQEDVSVEPEYKGQELVCAINAFSGQKCPINNYSVFKALTFTGNDENYTLSLPSSNPHRKLQISFGSYITIELEEALTGLEAGGKICTTITLIPEGAANISMQYDLNNKNQPNNQTTQVKKESLTIPHDAKTQVENLKAITTYVQRLDEKSYSTLVEFLKENNGKHLEQLSQAILQLSVQMVDAIQNKDEVSRKVKSLLSATGRKRRTPVKISQ